MFRTRVLTSPGSGDRPLGLAPLDEKVDHVRGSPAGRLIIEYGAILRYSGTARVLVDLPCHSTCC
jgi:hypothetical protein